MRLLLVLALSLLTAAAPPARDEKPLRVLFIGNSLTAANDLPGMVERRASASGWPGRLTCEMVARANFSLEDHWRDGAARTAIRRGGWTHVVLQQGPSSLPASQVLLREYAAKFAAEARAVGAKVVLYGVWPPRERLRFQRDVTEAYTRAAAAVGGQVVPVGDGWAAAWGRDASLALYGDDGFHPSPLGSELAASMLFTALTGWNQSRTIAVTIDDLPTVSVLGEQIERAEQTTRDLLAAIGRAKTPVIGFVNERKLQPAGKEEPRRVALLQQWLDAGLELGNHTYSHVDLHQTDIADFEKDVALGDTVTTGLLAARGRTPRYFRHPFLHTGRSQEVRDRLGRFLSARGYTVAPVTVDNYDYMFARAYDRAVEAGDRRQLARVTEAYLAYMQAVVEYYERQSVAILGREVAQTLLLHANALNAATFERLVERLRARGYGFVTLEEALKDPAYELPDEYYGPAGITWLHRWAITKGMKGSVFAGEPEVPDWIRSASERR